MNAQRINEPYAAARIASWSFGGSDVDTEPGSLERRVCCACIHRSCEPSRRCVGSTVHIHAHASATCHTTISRPTYLANGLPGGNICVLDVGIDLHVSRHALTHALHQEGVIGSFYLHRTAGCTANKLRKEPANHSNVLCLPR